MQGRSAAAMKNSKKLQDAMTYEPMRMVFKAINLFSGMFCIDRQNSIGILLSEQFYGEKSMTVYVIYWIKALLDIKSMQYNKNTTLKPGNVYKM